MTEEYHPGFLRALACAVFGHEFGHDPGGKIEDPEHPDFSVLWCKRCGVVVGLLVGTQ